MVKTLTDSIRKAVSKGNQLIETKHIPCQLKEFNTQISDIMYLSHTMLISKTPLVIYSDPES